MRCNIVAVTIARYPAICIHVMIVVAVQYSSDG